MTTAVHAAKRRRILEQQSAINKPFRSPVRQPQQHDRRPLPPRAGTAPKVGGESIDTELVGHDGSSCETGQGEQGRAVLSAKAIRRDDGLGSTITPRPSPERSNTALDSAKAAEGQSFSASTGPPPIATETAGRVAGERSTKFEMPDSDPDAASPISLARSSEGALQSAVVANTSDGDETSTRGRSSDTAQTMALRKQLNAEIELLSSHPAARRYLSSLPWSSTNPTDPVSAFKAAAEPFPTPVSLASLESLAPNAAQRTAQAGAEEDKEQDAATRLRMLIEHWQAAARQAAEVLLPGFSERVASSGSAPTSTSYPHPRSQPRTHNKSGYTPNHSSSKTPSGSTNIRDSIRDPSSSYGNAQGNGKEEEEAEDLLASLEAGIAARRALLDTGRGDDGEVLGRGGRWVLADEIALLQERRRRVLAALRQDDVDGAEGDSGSDEVIGGGQRGEQEEQGLDGEEGVERGGMGAMLRAMGVEWGLLGWNEEEQGWKDGDEVSV